MWFSWQTQQSDAAEFSAESPPPVRISSNSVPLLRTDSCLATCRCAKRFTGTLESSRGSCRQTQAQQTGKPSNQTPEGNIGERVLSEWVSQSRSEWKKLTWHEGDFLLQHRQDVGRLDAFRPEGPCRWTEGTALIPSNIPSFVIVASLPSLLPRLPCFQPQQKTRTKLCALDERRPGWQSSPPHPHTHTHVRGLSHTHSLQNIRLRRQRSKHRGAETGKQRTRNRDVNNSSIIDSLSIKNLIHSIKWVGMNWAFFTRVDNIILTVQWQERAVDL